MAVNTLEILNRLADLEPMSKALALTEASIWERMLPELIINKEKREAFFQTFGTSENLLNIRAKIHGSKKSKWRFTEAMLGLIQADYRNEEQGLTCEQRMHAQAALGRMVIEAVNNADWASLRNLQAAKNGSYLNHKHTDTGHRWIAFCEYLCNKQMLPTKAQTKQMWQLSLEKEDDFLRVKNEKKANKWRNELGLNNLP